MCRCHFNFKPDPVHGTELGESYNGRSGLTVITGVRLIESVQEESFFDQEALALAN